MALFPRWSNLKHFRNVSTTTFGDGQAFYDILKVQFLHLLFPFNTPAVFTVHSTLYCSAFAKKLNFHQLHSDISALSLDDWFELYI